MPSSRPLKNYDLRKFILLLALLVLGGLSMTATPASATDQSEAVKLCGKNPMCGIAKGNGGVSLTIDSPGGRGGTSAEIFCPDQGACVCVLCPRVGPKTLSIGATVQLGTTRVNADDPAPGSSGSSGGSQPSGTPATAGSGDSGGWSGSIGQWHGTTDGSGGSPGQIN